MINPAATLARHWDRFWFEAGSGQRLALARIGFYGGLLYVHRNLETAQWAAVDPVFWFPTPLFAALEPTLPSASTLSAIAVTYRVALAAACVGLLTRLSTLLACVLGIYVIALPHNFGKVHHSDAMLVFVLGALALARLGDHLSIDALLRRFLRRFLRRNAAVPDQHPEYRWPIRFAQVCSVMIYGAAGIAKIKTSGLAWIAPDAFGNLLLYHQHTHKPVVDWGIHIAQLPWLCTTLAALTILVETAAPLALVHRRMAAVLIPGLAAMQLGVHLVLGVTFKPFLLLLPFWIPWEALGPRLAHVVQRRTSRA